MNTGNIKNYAPKARKAFIEAVSKQAAKYGIARKMIEVADQKGDLVLIGGKPFPAAIIKPRERLVAQVQQQGFDKVMEHVVYSWFNRLCAIRYMELKESRVRSFIITYLSGQHTMAAIARRFGVHYTG